jgi:DMSO/TMAO reductase YedYZ molybdopterin-dependent catalytic subunit
MFKDLTWRKQVSLLPILRLLKQKNNSDNESEKMEKSKYRIVLPYLTAFIVIVLFVALLVVGLPKPVQVLYPSEVRNYQGEKLSSIVNIYQNAIMGTQFLNESTYRLTIKGLVNQTTQLTYSEVVNDFDKYQKVVTIYCIEGWNAKILWEGVLVKDLLLSVGANMSASVVIFYAADGYSTALPLDYLVNNNILLAYKMNDIVIPTERGFPFQLVAESQYGYKWIKWVTEIEVSNNANYLGYWESRGLANNATIR